MQPTGQAHGAYAAPAEEYTPFAASAQYMYGEPARAPAPQYTTYAAAPAAYASSDGHAVQNLLQHVNAVLAASSSSRQRASLSAMPLGRTGATVTAASTPPPPHAPRAVNSATPTRWQQQNCNRHYHQQ